MNLANNKKTIEFSIRVFDYLKFMLLQQPSEADASHRFLIPCIWNRIGLIKQEKEGISAIAL
ncbi:hypothetical protein RO3G_01546 [Rhizopus delemar RA 99-880]|uniref:Uncharacterized protein n=1 Tax=Rhizopus delemar (strain RA 99-880 / ATCC MYA-4621 / FGSC 9543 / NRRL 43880) TaxID=246409 RepID=I1BKW2_RHIO9|nr:hypothetical protein RO3G_01546 [Rhizopus delemar RA 99-880]|eukprot:EIE76842.1 hypothetical protein RO3G_01546 [Rhizopus delemar RA 99-880]